MSNSTCFSHQHPGGLTGDNKSPAPANNQAQLTMLTAEMRRFELQQHQNNSGSRRPDVTSGTNSEEDEEYGADRELESLRGDSPLTIDSVYNVDHDDDEQGGVEEDEQDRALFSPTTDEDKVRKERKQQQDRQRKLSLSSASSPPDSSISSMSSSSSSEEEMKMKKRTTTAGAQNGCLTAKTEPQTVPVYYNEPDWTVTFCDGIPYKAYKGTYFYPMYTPDFFKSVEQFEAKDDDIVLCSFMKTGTTWLQSIILAMLHGPNVLTRGEAHQLSPCLERTEDPTAVDGRSGLQMIRELPKNVPRFYQTHLPLRAMPESIANNQRLRMIYITRNPKDTAVSWYYFLRHARERLGEEMVPHISVQQFGRQIMGQSPQPYGPFMKHVEEFWDAHKNYQNILFLTYEQLQQRYVETVQEIAKFLGKDFAPETIIQIARSCRLDSLKALEVNQRDSQSCGLHTTSFFRKGQTGTWKEHFTVAFNEEMDEWLKSESAKTDFRFEFV